MTEEFPSHIIYPEQEPPGMTLSPDQEAARRIVCAAIRHRETGVKICGARHHNCLHSACRFGKQGEWEQGFIDQFHQFLTREEAWLVAVRQNQIFRRCGGDEGKLFSENLY